MTTTSTRAWLGMLALCGWVAAACSSGGGANDGSGEDRLSAEDALIEGTDDGDADASDEGGPDVEPDIGPDADGEVDADADGDVDTDGEAVRDGDADVRDGDGDVDDVREEVDADALLPTGCRFVLPTRDIGYGWSGRYSIDAGKFVWRWIDVGSGSSVRVLMEQDLSSGADREVLRRPFPDQCEIPSVHGNWVAFFSRVGLDPQHEVFRVSLAGGSEERLTANTISDAYPRVGSQYVVYLSNGSAELKYVGMTDLVEHHITDLGVSAEAAFDGERWVAFDHEDYLYKFDLADPGSGARRVAPYTMGITGLAFDRDTGVLIVAALIPSETDDFRLEEWDLSTDTRTIILDEPWSQVVPDVDGHVVVYQDSQAAGETYFAHQFSDLRIVDRDTGVKRVVMPLDTYYGVGIWERWIAFNNYGVYGDSLIICDLVEAGYMSDDLHVRAE